MQTIKCYLQDADASAVVRKEVEVILNCLPERLGSYPELMLMNEGVMAAMLQPYTGRSIFTSCGEEFDITHCLFTDLKTQDWMDSNIAIYAIKVSKGKFILVNLKDEVAAIAAITNIL